MSDETSILLVLPTSADDYLIRERSVVGLMGTSLSVEPEQLSTASI